MTEQYHRNVYGGIGGKLAGLAVAGLGLLTGGAAKAQVSDLEREIANQNPRTRVENPLYAGQHNIDIDPRLIEAVKQRPGILDDPELLDYLNGDFAAQDTKAKSQSGLIGVVGKVFVGTDRDNSDQTHSPVLVKSLGTTRVHAYNPEDVPLDDLSGDYRDADGNSLAVASTSVNGNGWYSLALEPDRKYLLAFVDGLDSENRHVNRIREISTDTENALNWRDYQFLVSPGTVAPRQDYATRQQWENFDETSIAGHTFPQKSVADMEGTTGTRGKLKVYINNVPGDPGNIETTTSMFMVHEYLIPRILQKTPYAYGEEFEGIELHLVTDPEDLPAPFTSGTMRIDGGDLGGQAAGAISYGMIPELDLPEGQLTRDGRREIHNLIDSVHLILDGAPASGMTQDGVLNPYGATDDLEEGGVDYNLSDGAPLAPDVTENDQVLTRLIAAIDGGVRWRYFSPTLDQWVPEMRLVPPGDELHGNFRIAADTRDIGAVYPLSLGGQTSQSSSSRALVKVGEEERPAPVIVGPFFTYAQSGSDREIDAQLLRR